MTQGLNSFLYGAAPVPGPGGWFEALSFLTFTAHILFMNAVLGIVLISFFRGLCAPRGAETHPVDAALHAGGSMLPKGLAIVVNLGVAPLLFLQVLYGQFAYSAAIIQGFWWLGIMMLVMTAYYGLYLATGQQRQGWRTLILGVCGFLLVGTALMQTANAALVLNPQIWPAWLPERGSALLLPGLSVILPRFMHSLVAAFAVGGLCLALYGEMRRGKEEPQPESVTEGLQWFIYATLGQLVVGLWYFFSLPSAQRQILLGEPRCLRSLPVRGGRGRPGPLGGLARANAARRFVHRSGGRPDDRDACLFAADDAFFPGCAQAGNILHRNQRVCFVRREPGRFRPCHLLGAAHRV